MTPRRLLLFSFAWVLSTACPMSRGSAQEVGVSFVYAFSEHREFPSPRGFSVYGMFPASPHWFGLLGFNRLADASDKEGRVCVSYSPHIGCGLEETHTEVSLAGLRGGLVRSFSPRDGLRLGLGGGLSFNQVKAEATGVSGRPADILVKNGGQIGFFGLLSTSVRPAETIPAWVTGRFTFHHVDFNACSGQDPPQYDPFCTTGSFGEVEVGLSYSF